MTPIKFTFFAAVVAMLSACGGGGSSDCSAGFGGAVGGSGLCDKSSPAAPADAAPVAVAGTDQSILVGAVVTLDGSNSRDPEGKPITYLWSFRSKPAGSTATLTSTAVALPSFVADKAGVYVANLLVNDGLNDSSLALVTITSAERNAAPVANAGPRQNVSVGSTVNLDGSFSSDANRDPLVFTWKFESIPNGSNATLSATNTARPTFRADTAGSYVASLTVSDGTLTSNFTTVSVTASSVNSAPTARIGAVEPVAVGKTVTFNGATSSDPDRDPLTYKWVLISQPMGSASALTSVAIAQPSLLASTAGNYVASLAVNDGTADSDLTFVILTVMAPPVAKIQVTDGAKAIVGDIPSGTALTLDASQTADPAKAPLTYKWRLTVAPAANKVAIVNDSADKASFTPTELGNYVLTFVASNAVSDSNLETLLLKVVAAAKP